MLAMIDMGINNLGSVINAFKLVGTEVKTTSDPKEIAGAPALVLPGVGAFEPSMNALNESGVSDVVRQRVGAEGVPMIGICLGMQLLADESFEHGRHQGLGLIKGVVKQLETTSPDYRVPNIGWCDTRPAKAGVLFPEGIETHTYYYVHGYHMCCEDESDIAAVMDFGDQDITVAVERGNIFGAQFHPEKSQDVGLDLLERYVLYLRERKIIS